MNNYLDSITESKDKNVVRELYYNYNKDYIIEKIKETNIPELPIPETFEDVMQFLSYCKKSCTDTLDDKIKHLSLIYSALIVMYKIKPNIELIKDQVCCDYCSAICGLNCCCSDDNNDGASDDWGFSDLE